MKPRVIDLFCGCGGISEGFRLAGFEIVGGLDFNQDAVETYNQNFTDAEGFAVIFKRFQMTIFRFYSIYSAILM